MLRETIQKDILDAMKQKDKLKMSVLRMLKSDIQKESIEKKHDLSNEEVITVIKRGIKQRKDSIEEYTKYNRLDTVKSLQDEIKILENYMPKQLSEEEIAIEVDNILKEYPGATIKDMGHIMSILKEKIGTTCDMSIASKILKSKLS